MYWLGLVWACLAMASVCEIYRNLTLDYFRGIGLRGFSVLFISCFFCNRRISFLSFSGPQLYNSEALPFTYDQSVVIELADKLCYCLFLCEFMNFHPDKQLFQSNL